MTYLGAAGVILVTLCLGCSTGPQATPMERGEVDAQGVPDTRTAIGLPEQAAHEHRAVMLQHLETIEAIVAALAEEDFERAQGLTEAHLGFFMHRQAMARQDPNRFPAQYHDLAMAHHEAAETLANVMPSRNLKQILPELSHVLKACVACHLEYKVAER